MLPTSGRDKPPRPPRRVLPVITLGVLTALLLAVVLIAAIAVGGYLIDLLHWIGAEPS